MATLRTPQVRPRLSVSGLRAPALRLRAALNHRPLLIVLGLGLLLRVLTMALYFPAIMDSYDSPRFARAVPEGLFNDFWMPAGYPAFLKVIRHVSDEFWFTIAVQHLLGLGTAAAAFLGVRRLGAAPWIGVLAAALLTFSGDLLYLEHIMMADQFLFLFALLACVCTVAGLVPRTDRRWLAAAGVMAMFSMLSRSVGLAVVFALLVCVVWLCDGPGWRGRVLSAGALGLGAVAVLLVYVAAFEIKDGRYLGLGDMRGWNLYSRVAPFAKCSQFTPPRGTRVLCESRPPSQRPGPFGYVWDVNSTPRRTFALGPETGGPLDTFAVRAIEHQPGAYLLAVATDLGRYIEPSIGTQNGYNGQPRELVSFGQRNPDVERLVESQLATRYDGVTLHAPGAHLLTVYQQIFRIDRLALLLALLLTVFGMVRLRGAPRVGVAVFGLTALGLYVLPTLTISYDFRYGIPPSNLLGVSAIISGWGLLQARANSPASRSAARASGSQA